ncbi:ER membrane protein complex subunit 3-like [Armigeres subalbatus]|uniref:ER membrane protein complex subunit 3-like n=1 Tax=Armigeres subalbatus TaxID=124917 RepID=UPI002ED5CBEC
MIRARLLRKNGKYLTPQSFAMRRHYFNNEETGRVIYGLYTNGKTHPPCPDMIKGNDNSDRWISWLFSGLVTTKVPFPLTLRFKPRMLQLDIELVIRVVILFERFRSEILGSEKHLHTGSKREQYRCLTGNLATPDIRINGIHTTYQSRLQIRVGSAQNHPVP